MNYNETVFELSYENIEIIKNKFGMLPRKAEYELNNYLWNNANEILRKKVMQNMPRSNRDKSNIKKAPKVHAKDVESLEDIRYNLGIKVQTKLTPRSKDFGYLIFPDEGRGKHQTRSQEFFSKALNSETDKIKTGLIEHLNKKIEEELNNGS